MARVHENEKDIAMRQAEIRRFLDETILFDKPPITPEVISPGDIEVVEANGTEWMAVTHANTAEEYMAFHGEFDYFDQLMQNVKYQNLKMRVLKDVCDDEYSSDDRSRTFIAFTEKAGLVGQIRLGLGKTDAEFPLEMMSLFDNTAGWPYKNDGVSDDGIVEIGRVVVAPGQRPLNTAVILRSLLARSFDYAIEHGYEQAIVVKPTRHPDPIAPEGKLAPLHMRMVELGVEPEIIRPAVLRPDSPVVKTYTGYFDKLAPRAYRWKEIPRITA